MKKKKIIITTLFNAWVKSDDVLKKEWIERRMSVFMKYTLNSLKLQTNQDFLVLLRYHNDTADLIRSALERYKPLPKNIIFVSSKNYDKEIIKHLNGYDTLYMVRLDSDDMFHKSFIRKLHEYKPKKNTEVLISQKGYIYDSVNNRIVEYFHPSPPYHALIYRVEDYLKGKRYRLASGHWDAIKLRHEILEGKNFISHVHSNNTLFSFERSKGRMVGDIITDKSRINSILKEYM